MDRLTYDAVVVGSGAAGLSAASRLHSLGVKVLLLCENLNLGTSRNAGSDKQTYYKISLSGDDADSVKLLAENLFSTGAVDGDTALCEAALSARCFFKLVELGVPFPHNSFGEYVGYKTDHDPKKRATSAGPLTSKLMTEAWETKVKEQNIPILDGYMAVKVLKDDDKVLGLSAISVKTGELINISSTNVILATGGPSGIYYDSVYPYGQTGAMSLFLDAGVKMQNLTEWQYGLASVSPRWNVSGTYMQVLPRFVSLDEEGNEYEFLSDYFVNPYEALSMVFLKGYQWPFDSAKVFEGSSVIDLLVFNESKIKGRKVFLDFTKNPFGLQDIEFSKLSPEAYDYLKRANALIGTPIERLSEMNMPAVDFYKSKGVDLEKEYLEIALSSQHHNGGASVDFNWQTNVTGLFAIGECAGTHGITRPGGSALNAGQVGALRAASYIYENIKSQDEASFKIAADEFGEEYEKFIGEILENKANVSDLIKEAERKMSEVGGAIRDNEKIKAYLMELKEKSDLSIKGKEEIYKAYKYIDILKSQRAVLTAISSYIEEGLSSRGSCLILDKEGILPSGLNESFRYRMSGNKGVDLIQEVVMKDGKIKVETRKVRPIPSEDDFFENVFKEFIKKHKRGGEI